MLLSNISIQLGSTNLWFSSWRYWSYYLWRHYPLWLNYHLFGGLKSHSWPKFSVPCYLIENTQYMWWHWQNTYQFSVLSLNLILSGIHNWVIVRSSDCVSVCISSTSFHSRNVASTVGFILQFEHYTDILIEAYNVINLLVWLLHHRTIFRFYWGILLVHIRYIQCVPLRHITALIINAKSIEVIDYEVDIVQAFY